jgi:vacuolar-type H+-ATPase subunit I/STV1
VTPEFGSPDFSSRFVFGEAYPFWQVGLYERNIMSPRPRSLKTQLLECMTQLDEYIKSDDARKQPAVVNALTMKLEVFQKLMAREDEQRDLDGQIAALEQKLATFDDVDPQAVSLLTEENRTLKVQLENLRASNASTVTERDDARGQLDNALKFLQWLAQQVNEPKKVILAARAFAEYGRDSKVLVDAIMSVGTCAEWEKLAASKQKLVETFKEYRTTTNPAGIKSREFCRLVLAAKHGTNIDKVLAEQAEQARQQEASEEQRHERAVFEREQLIARQRREAARQAQIDAADREQSSPAPSPRGDLEW